MTLNGKIIQALSGFGYPVVPDLYTGTAERYYTFNFDLIPAQFADGRPLFHRALIQVHYFCPLGDNSIKQRADTVKALIAAGFTYPAEINATENEKQNGVEPCQHFVFECEAVEPTDRI